MKKRKIFNWVGVISFIVFIGTSTPVMAESTTLPSITQSTNDDNTASVIVNNSVDGITTLPDGNTVSTDISTYTVAQNGVYSFSQKSDGEVNSITKSVSGLYSTALVTNNPNVVLQLTATDTLSGMGYMKFKNGSSGTWSSYEPFKTNRNWTLENTEGLKSVYVMFKDIAGNETTQVYDNIYLDYTGPTINKFLINNGDSYTTTQKVRLTVDATDNYSEVKSLMISNDNVNWTTVPYNSSVLWNLTSNCGTKTVYIKGVDSLGNIGETVTDTIILDNILPTGSITINNGASVVNTQNVKLQISFADAESGVKRVTIIEGNKSYTFPTVPNSPSEVDWKLSLGLTGQVTLEVEDKAGNIYKTNSNKVNIATLALKEFNLTNVVNPPVFNTASPFTPLKWSFPAQEMKAGANISFSTLYGIDVNKDVTTTITGDYTIDIMTDDGSYHKVIANSYGEKITNGFKATITLPEDAPTNAKVYARSTVTAKIADAYDVSTQKVYFPDKSAKALIGIIKGNIKDDIRFNEIN